MKAYLVTTCAIFVLITLAHIWRVIAESPQLARDPVYIFLTLLSAGLGVWAWRLLRAGSRP